MPAASGMPNRLYILANRKFNTTSAASAATSVPEAIAIPTSACASAGLSFTPSPTIATRMPISCIRWILATLCDGNTSANTRLMPTWRAMLAAVFLLSPVSSITSMPIRLSVYTAKCASGFTMSDTDSIHTSCPFIAQRIAVWPICSSSDMRIFTSGGTTIAFRAIHSRFPISTLYSFTSANASPDPASPPVPAGPSPIGSRWSSCCSSIVFFCEALSCGISSSTTAPFMNSGCCCSLRVSPTFEMTHRMPHPGTAEKLLHLPKPSISSVSFTYFTIAVAIGCSLFTSADPTMVSARAREQTAGFTSMQMRDVIGIPCVIVPVLSNTIVFTLCAFSSGPAPFTRMPCRAPTPVDTMTAVGVASPSAHGQAIASTLSAQRNA
uniref:Uncharacterized protein n=1 Tax=Anopheles melas TaxID=34690 RepID=A0A182THM6_9DIPT